MRLTIGVGQAAGETLVVVDAAPAATTAAFLRELGKALRTTTDRRLWVERTGDPVEPSDQPLTALDLRHGDRLVTTAPPAPAQPYVHLAVDRGPDAGLLLRLGAGSTVVGRASGVDLRLADLQVSREHLTLGVGPKGVVATDLGTSNGTWLDGRRLDAQPVELRPGATLELGEHTALLLVPSPSGRNPATTRAGRLAHNRPPRITASRPVPRLEVRSPPEAPRPQRLPMVTALLPVLGALVLYAITQQPAVLAMAALAPLVALGSWWESRRGRNADFASSAQRYLDAVETTAARWDEHARAESARLDATHPGPGRIAARVAEEDSSLWERRPGDNDFLSLRVGTAHLVGGTAPEVPYGGDDQLRAQACELLAGRGRAAGPAVVPISSVGALGLTGPTRRDMLRWLVAQAAALHSPADLRLVVLSPDTAGWEWVRWLPHTGQGLPAVVADGAEARDVVERVSALVAARAAASRTSKPGTANTPLHLLVIDDPPVVPLSALSDLLASGPAQGVHFLVSAATLSSLPGAAGAVLDTAEAVLQQPSGLLSALRLDGFSPSAADALARRLAGMTDAGARDATADLPTSLTLGEILGNDITDPTRLAGRWAASSPGISAVVGVTVSGPMRIELRGDTSHALVGGTTGSGKSELLQTLVASLAVEHPPTDVTFLLVDYKGGAAFKDCVHLPHVVGFVTDLDGLLVHRALTSLRAEIQRRQRLLKAAGAQSLDEMVRRAVADRPPYLLLVVDEFATLTKELPEFVDGVVDIAQRGRSLGVHLVLATQRPAGSINDAIRTNVPLRMALRLNDVSDSDDVLGSPVAARIPRGLPGRGFVRRSHNELEAFQAAYVGASSRSDLPDLTIRQVPAPDSVEAPAAAPDPVPADDGRTDLQRIVAAAAEAFAASGAPAPARPWLPPLPAVLPTKDLPPAPSGTVCFGLLDEPSAQAQQPLVFDLERDGSLLVAGAPGSGTSTALRTIAAQAAASHSSDELWVYGIDCGTRALQPLTHLPHTGAVIAGTDIERVSRLLDQLRGEIDRRREAFGSTGAGSLREHIAAGGKSFPRILLLLDDLGGFRAGYEQVENGRLVEALPRLVVDGRAAGVHLVLSADRRASVSSALLQVLGARVVLRLSDADEYSLLGLEGRVATAAVLGPGAGFVGGTRSVQIAVLGNDPRGDQQSDLVERLGAVLCERDAALPVSSRAPTVGRLEASIPRPVGRPASVGPAGSAGSSSALGISGGTLEPVSVSPSDGHLLISGPARSGRSSALVAWAEGLQDPQDTARWLIASRRSKAAGATVWDRVIRPEDVAAAGAELEALPPEARVMLAIDDAQDLVDTEGEEAMVRLLAQDRPGLWAAGVSDSASARRAYRGLLVALRKDRHALLLAPDPALDAELVGAALPKRPPGPVPPGRGVVSRAGLVEVVQVYTSS